MDPTETVAFRGGAVLLPPAATRVESYANLAEAIELIAEGNRFALPLADAARRFRAPLGGTLLGALADESE